MQLELSQKKQKTSLIFHEMVFRIISFDPYIQKEVVIKWKLMSLTF